MKFFNKKENNNNLESGENSFSKEEESATKLTNSELIKKILYIGLPAAFEVFVTTITNVINSKMVSHLGTGAINSINVTNNPRLFILTIFLAMNTVLTALVAGYVGKKQRENANRTFKWALLFTIVIGVIATVVSVSAADPIMRLCYKPTEWNEETIKILNDSIMYFRIIMGGILFNLLSMCINASFRGYGQTRVTLISNIVSCAFNVGFNALFLYGVHMQIEGAAYASMIGQACSLIVSIIFLFNRKGYINIHMLFSKKTNLTLDTLIPVMNMWCKIFIENIGARLGFLIAGVIITMTKSQETTIYYIGMNLLNFNLAVGTGLQVAGVSLVGKSYSAREFKAAKRISNLLFKISFIGSGILMILYCGLGGVFYSMFLDKSNPNFAEFVRLGWISAAIIAAITPIQVLQVTYVGLNLGIKEAKYTMISSIVANTIVNSLAVALFVLAFKWGIWGLWAATAIAQLTRFLILFFHFNKKFYHNPDYDYVIDETGIFKEISIDEK